VCALKNYPNQASSFRRVRGTLQTINDLNAQGSDVTNDEVLGYAAARRGHYTFRGLPDSPTFDQLERRIVDELAKARGSQGAQTFARELRRTLFDMGWLDDQAQATAAGQALLDSEPVSVEEQALLVEGLLNIQATNKDGSEPNRPVLAMLRLLGRRPCFHRSGLELALEPFDDSDAEFARIAALYDLPLTERLEAHDITATQRANAVKIFPSLAVYAGLVVEEEGEYSLSQDGWRIIGETPAEAGQTIRRRSGRRTTVGRLVNAADAGRTRNRRPPRTLSPEEQARAAGRLAERDDAHQAIVRRVSQLIGDGHGQLLEDDFSYDLLWIPTGINADAVLFEMKTVTGATDAYAQARRGHGQLSYYDFFYVRPTLEGRGIRRVLVFDSHVPDALVGYLTYEEIAVLVSAPTGELEGVNSLGSSLLGELQGL
jgi:hypothetical protein